MPVVHETDRRFDELGAAISRRFMDVNGKVEVTRNPPDRDPYQGDGRSALGDAQVTHYCANCEATERQKKELVAELADLRQFAALQTAASDRAIKLWQAAHPDRSDVWPDQAKLLVWLLEQLDAMRAERDRLKSLRTAIIAYVAARDREENSSEQALLDDLTIWGATEDTFAALKAAAGIDAKEGE